MSVAVDPLVPVKSLLPEKDNRWIADACRGVKARAGQDRRPPIFPNAVKVGRTWMIRRSDFDTVVSPSAKPADTAASVEDAAAFFRTRGLS